MEFNDNRLDGPDEKDRRIAQLERSIALYQSTLREKFERIEHLERDREEFTRSISFRLARRIGLIGSRVAPPETGRRRFLTMAFRGTKAISKLWSREDVASATGAPQSKTDVRLTSKRVDGAHVEHRPGLVVSRLVSAHNTDSFSRGHVLIIDHRLPTPDRDCGSLRMMEILRRLVDQGQRVSFVADDMHVIEPYLTDLRDVGVEVMHPPHYRSVADFLLRRGAQLNLVIISRADVAERHMAAVRCLAPSARIVFDTVDLHFLRESREAEIKQDPELWTSVEKRKNQELELARAADLTLVVSPIEKALLEEECPGEVEIRIVPTIYRASVDKPPGFTDRKNLIFIGGFEHAPNVDAVLYFAREILPRIHDRIPQAIFQVIGPDPTPEIRQLASQSFQILGFVPDVKPIFGRARVAVAPVRFGAGVKGKVNQSMALGVPTVVTSIAAEGMYLVHDHNAMIADDPDGFADAVVRLWCSEQLWERVSFNGLQSLREHFSVEAAGRAIDEVIQWAGLPLASTNPLERLPVVASYQ